MKPKKRQRIMMIALFWLIFIFLLVFTAPSAAAAPNPPVVGAAAAVLMEAETGQILYAKNPHEKRVPASITKIMTVILALERGKLEDKVTASAKAAATEESKIYLWPGEQMILRDLLYGAMVWSGNDTTVAIAEHIAGSEEAFARLMNEKARELGARNTNFVNSNGLPHPAHYSTAYDLALIARYAMQNPLFRQMAATREIHLTSGRWTRHLSNSNRLLWEYPGADGIKTGTTSQAGECLAFSAARDGRRLIGVVLNSPDRYGEAKALLDYGFSAFGVKTVLARGQLLDRVVVEKGREKKVPVVAGDGVRLAVPREGPSGVGVKVEKVTAATAPVRAGEKLGRVRVFWQGQQVAEVPLVAAKEVTLAPWWQRVIPQRLFREKG